MIRKRKIPVGSVVTCAVLGLPVAYLTYRIVRDGFVWYSVFPGIFAGFFIFGGLAIFFTGDDSKDEQAKTAATDPSPGLEKVAADA